MHGAPCLSSSLLNIDSLRQFDPPLSYPKPKLFVGRVAAPLIFTAAVFRLFFEPLNVHCELTIVARIGSPLNERATVGTRSELFIFGCADFIPDAGRSVETADRRGGKRVPQKSAVGRPRIFSRNSDPPSRFDFQVVTTTPVRPARSALQSSPSRRPCHRWRAAERVR